jgi:hypothetical protein
MARHHDASPELDRARDAALSAVFPRATTAALLATFWREVFRSHLKTWAGLAAVWLILGALHFSNRPAALPLPGAESAVAREEFLAAWQRQRRMLTEISPARETTPPPPTPPAVPAKTPGRTSAMRPSSHHA